MILKKNYNNARTNYLSKRKEDFHTNLMQTMPNSDCWKRNFLNWSCFSSSQNRLAGIILKETLNCVHGIAKWKADYEKPKQFLYNILAFQKISQAMNCCRFEILCNYWSNSDQKLMFLFGWHEILCKVMGNYYIGEVCSNGFRSHLVYVAYKMVLITQAGCNLKWLTCQC